MVSFALFHGINCLISWYHLPYFIVSIVLFHGIICLISRYHLPYFTVSFALFHGIICLISRYHLPYFRDPFLPTISKSYPAATPPSDEYHSQRAWHPVPRKTPHCRICPPNFSSLKRGWQLRPGCPRHRPVRDWVFMIMFCYMYKHRLFSVQNSLFNKLNICTHVLSR